MACSEPGSMMVSTEDLKAACIFIESAVTLLNDVEWYLKVKRADDVSG
jgi:hypothetical protein